MTVRQKMDQILNNNNSCIDCGEYHIDGRPHGIIQDTATGEIIVVSKSKDDIDDDGNPTTKTNTYPTLKDLLDDYKLDM